MRKQKGFTLIELVITVIFCFALAGWVQNIIKFTACDFEAPYKAEAIYGVGTLVPPVGAVTGWVDIKD